MSNLNNDQFALDLAGKLNAIFISYSPRATIDVVSGFIGFAVGLAMRELGWDAARITKEVNLIATIIQNSPIN